MRVFSRGVTFPVWALLLLVAAESTARAQVDFSEVVAFGDSLTDNDLLGRVYGLPQSLFGTDPMEGVFGRGAGPGDRLTNLALLGTGSRGLALQVAQYQKLRAQRRIGVATLVSFEIGSNDLLQHIGLLGETAPGERRAADRVVNLLVERVQKALAKLMKLAPEATFIVWTIPDLTLTPAYFAQLTSAEQTNVRAHIQRANASLAEYSRFDKVLVFDLWAFMRATVSDPPVLLGVPLLAPPAVSEPTALFADEVHPTAVANGLIANAILTGLNVRFGTDLILFSEEELAELAGILQPR